MKRMSVRSVVTLAFAGAGLANPVPASAVEPVQFAPHRAVYDVSLASAVAGSGVSGLTGRMVYELNGSSCEGYTQNMRFVTRMTNQEGAETLNDLRNSSWEDADGKKLRYSNSQYQDDVLSEASQGDANHAKDGVAATVDLTKPSKKRVTLPGDIYFPMQHASQLIQSAKTGRKLLTANLYDGSEKGDKYYATTAVLGNKFQPGASKSVASFKDAQRLAGLDSWPVTISYFDLGKDKQDATPAYELSFRYYENGVTSNLKIDYGEFAIQGELKELTFLDAGKCPSTSH